MNTRLPRPQLTEERLQDILARASRVYKGESQPHVRMAEDILLLISEIKHLRGMRVVTRSEDVAGVFAQAEATIAEMEKSLMSQMTHTETVLNQVHRHTRQFFFKRAISRWGF